MSENTVQNVTSLPEEKKSLKRFIPSKKTLIIAGSSAATAAAATLAIVKFRSDADEPLEIPFPSIETVTFDTNSDESTDE